MIRLNRYLSKCGIASRRGADKLILAGRVKVNGVVTGRLGSLINENIDRIEFDDKVLLPSEKAFYLLLNKPAGYITTVKDPFKRPTVMDLLPKAASLAPAGRLDLDTEGVLLFSNDGDLVHRLTHPRYEIEKRYRVRVDQDLKAADVRSLKKGVDIGLVRKVSADKIVRIGSDMLELSLHEGRNRQIKRMMGSLGYRVSYLRRIQFGPLRCDDLEAGEWRFLDEDEVRQLRQCVHLDPTDS